MRENEGAEAMEYAWLFAVGGGALILGLVMAFALMSKRRLTATEAALGREKTRQMYDGEKEAPAASRVRVGSSVGGL